MDIIGEMDIITTNVQISVHRAVLACDGSLINCGSFLAYYNTEGKKGTFSMYKIHTD